MRSTISGCFLRHVSRHLSLMINCLVKCSQRLRCQYLYFGTSQESKLSTWSRWENHESSQCLDDNEPESWSSCTVVVRLFIGTQNRSVALHSALIKTHEEVDLSPCSVIYRPVGSTMQLFTKLSSPNFAVLQVHQYLEPSILDVTETLRVKSQHPNSQPPHTYYSVQNCTLSPTPLYSSMMWLQKCALNNIYLTLTTPPVCTLSSCPIYLCGYTPIYIRCITFACTSIYLNTTSTCWGGPWTKHITEIRCNIDRMCIRHHIHCSV